MLVAATTIDSLGTIGAETGAGIGAAGAGAGAEAATGAGADTEGCGGASCLGIVAFVRPLFFTTSASSLLPAKESSFVYLFELILISFDVLLSLNRFVDFSLLADRSSP